MTVNWTYGSSLALLILCEIGLVVGVSFIIVQLRKKESWLRRFAQNLALLLFTSLLILVVAELLFALFFIQPDGINFTLASQGWSDRYWKPINSLGYRDYEWVAADLLHRKTIIVTGDSFVAGWGIADIEDRFSNQLGSSLADEYAVITVAQNGWGLPDELHALKTYPQRSEILILSHYINDIEPSGAALGMARPESALLRPPENWLTPLVENSHVINFIYWRVHRWQAYANPLNREDVQSYQGHLRELFEDPDVWQVHTESLDAIYKLSQEQGQTLIVVVFPDMLRVDETRDLGDQVIKFYRDLGVPVVDVAELVEDMPAQNRIVNRVDTHPSVEVHALTAEALKQIVLSLE